MKIRKTIKKQMNRKINWWFNPKPIKIHIYSDDTKVISFLGIEYFTTCPSPWTIEYRDKVLDNLVNTPIEDYTISIKDKEIND